MRKLLNTGAGFIDSNFVHCWLAQHPQDRLVGMLPHEGIDTVMRFAAESHMDHLVRAYADTYTLNVTTRNCSNHCGPYHFPEKHVPLMIVNILHKGRAGEVYDIGAASLITHVIDRAGHDRCDAIDGSKILRDLSYRAAVAPDGSYRQCTAVNYDSAAPQ